MKEKRKIMPPAYFYLGIAFIILIHFIFPVMQIVHYPHTLLGILFIFLGVMLNIWAWLLFTKNKTTQNPFKNPDKFINKRIYKISRNPMYLGMLIILIGIAVLMGSLTTFIFPIIFFFITNQLFVPLGEKNMERAFGKRYLEYKNKVRRWI